MIGSVVSSERLHQTAGALAAAVGVGTALAPGPFLRPFGIERKQVTGTATWGWRMFGIRTAAIGGLIIAGNEAARKALIPVQLADQVSFMLASRDPTIPPRAVNLARTVSVALIIIGGTAQVRDRTED